MKEKILEFNPNIRERFLHISEILEYFTLSLRFVSYLDSDILLHHPTDYELNIVTNCLDFIINRPVTPESEIILHYLSNVIKGNPAYSLHIKTTNKLYRKFIKKLTTLLNNIEYSGVIYCISILLRLTFNDDFGKILFTDTNIIQCIILSFNILLQRTKYVDIDTYTKSDIGKECLSVFQYLIEYSKVDYILTKKIDFLSYCNIMNGLLNDNTIDINIIINLLHFMKLFWTINEKYQNILISHFLNKNGMNSLANLIYNSNVIISSETTKLLLLMISSNNDIYNNVVNKYFRILY